MEGRLLAGYEVAERRGLAFLVREYQQVLLRKFKENARERLVSSGSVPSTGEDVDLECRYEAMPLSPVLLAVVSGLSYASLFASSEAGKQTRRVVSCRVASRLVVSCRVLVPQVDFDVAPCTIRIREAHEPGNDVSSSKFCLYMNKSLKY